jgi:hypothetical protein
MQDANAYAQIVRLAVSKTAANFRSVRLGKRGHGWVRDLCRCPRWIQKCDRRERANAYAGHNLDVPYMGTIEACKSIAKLHALAVKPERLDR